MSGRVPSRGYEGRDRGRRPDQPAGSPFSEGAVSRYYGGSSHQASSSRAKLASAGVSSSTKGSEASVTTVASESEDEYRSKSSRSHHRSGHHRRKQQRSERSPGAGIAGESLSPSDMSSSYDRRPQQQQSAMASVSLLQRPLKQTAGEEVQHGRSKNQHPRHGKKHEAKQRDNRMPDASQRDPVRPYPPLGTLQQGKASPSSFHQASPTTVQPKQIKGEYRYFDKMMRVHRRQSLLAQKASAGNPELLIRPQHFKQERHKHVESVNARGESSESRHAVGKRKILNGDVFARPVYNELFETNPSKNTAVFQKRTSVIAALVRPRNWRDGSQILRPSEFGRLDNKASNVSEDPFLDPSCSFLINSELFEHEPPNLERKHGSVFVALPIPSSGITLDPREALAEAGWVKSHPNDPVETTGGIGLSEKTDDQLRRALQVRSTSKGGGRARKGDDKLSGKSLSSNSRDTRKGGAPRSMPSSDKRSAAHSKTRNSNAPENSGEDVGKQMVIEPDLWSQGSPVDPATVWQEEEASFLSGEGSRVDGSSPRENSLDSGSESSEFDSLTTGRAVAASPASQVNRSNPPGSQDLWSLDSQSDPATAWQLQAVGAYPSKDSPPAPPQDNQFQVSLSPDPGSGFDTDPQLGDGMSNIGLENDRQLGDWAGRVPSFGEPDAGNVQDAGVVLSEDSGFSDPQPSSILFESQIGTLLSGVQVTFESYARMNFSAQPKGIWPFSVWKRVKFDLLLMYTKPRQHPCAPVSSWQDPLREPLLRSVPYRLRSKGLAVFAHLMAYMGDVPTSQSSTWHIHQILSCGIRYTGLRDEIYCQIIKQTTANPSRLSNVKGWQAMAICCGVFLPSDSFYLYLAAHLEQVASGNIARQGTADQLGQFAHGMVNPAEAAAYALERLRKLKRIGPRRLLPLSKEIEVVENMDTIPAEVALPDGSWQAFLLRPMDTSKEVVEHLVSILGLLEARSYGLYQLEPNGVEKLIASNAYILEVQAKCNAPATTPQNIQDIRFGAKSVEKLSRLLCGSANALVENSSPTTSVLRSEELGLGERGAGPQQFSDGSLHMMLKRKLYFIDLEKLPEDLRAIVLAFEYSQAVHDIVKGVHMVQEGDAMMLGAMQLRADCGTSRVDPEILAGIDGSKYGPPYCVQGNEGAWKDAIATTLASLPSSGGNSASWKQDYIDYVKARCPLYEACLFFVKPLSNFSMPEAMYLAVSSTGVSFVDASTRKSFSFLEYPEIASWGYTPTVFSIISGSMSISTDNQFETNQGLEISNTIQMCIGLLQAIQQKTIQAEPGGAGSQWDKPPQPFLQGEESDAYASDSSISSYGGTPDLVQAHAQAPVRQSSVAEQPWPQTPLEEATAQARSPSGASEEQQHRRKHRKHQKNPDNEQPLSPPSGS